MNRPVCCCSETCPVHCLVPSPAGRRRAPPQHMVRKVAGWEAGAGGVGGGVLRPDHLPHSSRRLLSQRGDLVQHARSGHTLVTRGEGGDIGVLGWGPRSPLVLHILIHSIFGTRKGTNISVLNSVPSLPPAPSWLRCGCPVFHLWPLTATATPRGAEDAPAGLGLARVPEAALGPCLSLLPSLSERVPHDPSGAARRRGGRRPGLLGASRVWWPGRPLPWGWEQGPHLLPAISLTGSLPGRSLASSPHCWATTAKKPLPQTPKSPAPALFVCTPV